MSAAPPSLHADLDRFVDGELPPEEAERFREHLGGCEPCQARLHERVQLAGLAQGALGGEVIRPARWRARAAAGIGVALAAGLAVVIAGRLGGDPDPSLWLAGDPRRPLEARLSSPAADRWRPFETTRGVEPTPPPPLPELAKLERRGELLAIADAYLARGQPEAARTYLDRAGNGADALASRAAMDLMLGQPAEALHHASQAQVLAPGPGSGPARWNRALALRALGLPRAAAAELERVAAMGEPGWSGEAKPLAAQLLQDEERRAEAFRSAVELFRVSGGARSGLESISPRTARHWFYLGLHVAGTEEEVKALSQVAEKLDGRSGGDALRRAVKGVLEGKLQQRAALAREHHALLLGERAEPAAIIALADRARARGQPDIELRALELLPADRLDLERFTALARATSDPWFAALADERAAVVEGQVKGHPDRALELLAPRLAACAGSDRVEDRCLGLEQVAASASLSAGKAAQALALGQRALERARREGDLQVSEALLELLGRAAQARGDVELAAAYGAERARLLGLKP